MVLAKVITFCHVFKIKRNDIKFIVDDNILKQEKFTPGKNIKIIKFDNLKNKFVILLFGIDFSESIIKTNII